MKIKLEIGKIYEISGPETGIGRHFRGVKEIIITSEMSNYYGWKSDNYSGKFGNDSIVANKTEFVELKHEQHPLIFN